MAGSGGFVGGTTDGDGGVPTGLTQVGARPYDPQSGRFTAVDPVVDLTNPAQLAGVYSYAWQTPLTATDPTGTLPFTPVHNPRFAHQAQQSQQRARGNDAWGARYTAQAAAATPTKTTTRPGRGGRGPAAAASQSSWTPERGTPRRHRGGASESNVGRDVMAFLNRHRSVIGGTAVGVGVGLGCLAIGVATFGVGAIACGVAAGALASGTTSYWNGDRDGALVREMAIGGALGLIPGGTATRTAGRAATNAAPTAQEIIQSTARAQSARGADALRGALSPAERAAMDADAGLSSRMLGQAVHRSTADALDEAFPGRFLYSTRGPDFVDTTTGEMLELTTPGQVPSHLARPGYRGVTMCTYTLPVC